MTIPATATPLEEAARRFLTEKRCTLWQTYNVQTRRGMDEAVAFIASLVEEMNALTADG